MNVTAIGFSSETMLAWSAALCLSMFAPVAMAQADPHAAHREVVQSPQGASSTRVALPGTTLHMRDGSLVRLDSQTLGDRVVVVDFVFTHCTTICPALTAIMASVQRKLGPVGDEVLLVSVTVDPVRDTPARLDTFARSVGATEDWWWLTGPAAEIDRTLRAFGVEPGRPQDHPPMVLVGRPGEDRWLRWVGMPTPAQIVAAVDAMRDQGADEGARHADR